MSNKDISLNQNVKKKSKSASNYADNSWRKRPDPSRSINRHETFRNFQSVKSRRKKFEDYTLPAFDPDFYVGSSDRINAINAIVEIRTLWWYVIKANNIIYHESYKLLDLPLRADVKEYFKCHKEKFGVFHKHSQKWLHEPQPSTVDSYEFCYDGHDFIEFKEARESSDGKTLLLVGKYTILMQEVNLLETTDTADEFLNTFTLPSIDMIVGVPGCGKTTYILENHKIGNLVLTPSREGAADIRQRVEKLKPTITRNERWRHSYRTIDSYMLNSKSIYAEVWIDESTLKHPGEIFLVCLYSDCRILHLLGDPNQIGYINRNNNITLQFSEFSQFFRCTKTLSVSYRCPVDVIAVVSHKYPDGATSASKVSKSMWCKTFTSLKDVPKPSKSKSDKSTKYLVFKQAEKETMRKADYDVSTVHEYQGKEADIVIVVRMSSKKENLYNSAPHILVAMSRHKHILLYYTPVEDELMKIINTHLSGHDLNKHKHISDIKECACPVDNYSRPRDNPNPQYRSDYSTPRHRENFYHRDECVSEYSIPLRTEQTRTQPQTSKFNTAALDVITPRENPNSRYVYVPNYSIPRHRENVYYQDEYVTDCEYSIPLRTEQTRRRPQRRKFITAALNGVSNVFRKDICTIQ